MADYLTELFEQFSPEEQARLRAAEASANAVLANGDAEVRSRLRFSGSLDDRNWLLEPQDDARANAAGIIFVSYVNALWTNADRAREESVLAFLGKVDKLIPPVLNRFGAWESRPMISELRAECERGAWRVHAGLRGDADLNAIYARHSRHNGHGAGRQEDLLKDARAWAEEELRELSVHVEDIGDLQRRVVKRVWDEFVPRHRYHSDFQLGYREFASALWKEGLPSLEEVATLAIQERAASGSQTAQASDPHPTNRSDPPQGGRQVHPDESGTPPVWERLSPDDPNYDLLKRAFLKAWADSHGLVADGWAGQVPLSDYVEKCVNTFDQGAQVHVSFQDETPISERGNEIDRMADGSVAIFCKSFESESERLGQPEVAAAVEEYSRRIREIAARSKQSILLGALAAMPDPEPGSDGRPDPEDGAALTANETDAVGSIAEQTDPLVIAYREIAANSEAAVAALKRKVTAPITRVLYQDLEHAIWSSWQIRPDDVTVDHINHALHLLARNTEGGVELDPVSVEAYGIDFPRLTTLMQASILRGGDMSSAPKIPRRSALIPVTDQPTTEVARSPAETATGAQPRHEPGEKSTPAGPKKPGRPPQIEIARKEAAIAARERGESWKEVAKIVYDNKYPTGQQVKNAPNVLKNYKRTRVPPPNNS